MYILIIYMLLYVFSVKSPRDLEIMLFFLKICNKKFAKNFNVAMFVHINHV